MFRGVLALAMLFQAPVPDPLAPMTASWNTSPTGAGSTRLNPADDSRDGWEVHNVGGRNEWMRFSLQNGAPSVLLNTPSRVVYSLQGDFMITASTANPYMVEFTCVNSGGTSWGQPLVITVTQP